MLQGWEGWSCRRWILLLLLLLRVNNKTAARKTPGRPPHQELQSHPKPGLWERWIASECCTETTCRALAAPVPGAEVTGHRDSTRATWEWGARHHRGGRQRGNITGNGRDTGISSAGLILQWDYATSFSFLFPCPGQASQDSWVHSLRPHPSSPRCDPGCAVPEPLELFIIYSSGSSWEPAPPAKRVFDIQIPVQSRNTSS